MKLFICLGGSTYFSQIRPFKNIVLIYGIQNLICQIIYFKECPSTML